VLGVLTLGMWTSGCAWHSDLVSGTSGAAGNAQSYNPVVSADGTKVAFITAASDLGPTDSNGQDDVYVRDLTDGKVTNLNTNVAGDDSGDKGSGGPVDWASVFDATGTKAVFASGASNLGPADTNRFVDIYVRDLHTGSATRVRECGGHERRELVLEPPQPQPRR
jgi:Tol biopolymer transport system component